jgi:hypothetical protein
MTEIKIKCEYCGEESMCESPCPLTGFEYSSGWVMKCPRCLGSMKKVGRVGHISECEKTLNKIERIQK